MIGRLLAAHGPGRRPARRRIVAAMRLIAAGRRPTPGGPTGHSAVARLGLSLARRASLVAIALLTAACQLVSGPQVGGPYVPETAGILVSSEWVTENAIARYVLDTGDSLTANVSDRKATQFVYRDPGQTGDLVLGGEQPGLWIAFLAPASTTRSDLSDGCFALYSNGTDDGDWIQTDAGLRLRKAAVFDPGLLAATPDGPVPTAHVGLRYDGDNRLFCVNRDGLVASRV